MYTHMIYIEIIKDYIHDTKLPCGRLDIKNIFNYDFFNDWWIKTNQTVIIDKFTFKLVMTNLFEYKK